MYLISPTEKVAKYWANEMGIKKYSTICKRIDICGVDFSKMENFIYIEEQPFDYPEKSKILINYTEHREFEELKDYIESRIKIFL